MLRRSLNAGSLPLVGAVWVLGCALGLAALLDYSNAAGPDAAGPASWPKGLSFERSPGRQILVMAVHPGCACTRASLEELAVIRASTGEAFDIVVLAKAIPGIPLRPDVAQKAAEVPGARLIIDDSGRDSDRFAATVSGHVSVFDRSGRLTFSGGITASRGHAGSNNGRDAVIALGSGERPTLSRAPVFGCSFETPIS